MRVLHVTPYFAPAFRYGGPPRSILGLCRALAEAGVDVEVFTTTANGSEPLPPAPGGTVYDGVGVRYFPLAWPRRYWRGAGLHAAVAAEAARADLVHIHGLWNATGWAGAMAARAAGCPYVISPRGMLRPSARRRHRVLKSLAYWGLERASLRSAAFLHATSPVEAGELAQWGRPVVSIANGVTPVSVSPAAVERLRKSVRIDPDDEVVTVLGRLHPIKRLDLVAVAFALVLRARPRARLVIAGADEFGYRRHIEPLFAPVASATRWLGAVDSETAWALLAASRTLVQSSDSESFGMSVAEALTAGVPVVASNGSGWAEMEARGCGYLVPAEPAAVARAVVRILADPVESRAMGARGQEWARQAFSWNAIGRAMRDAYKDVLARSPKRRRCRS